MQTTGAVSPIQVDQLIEVGMFGREWGLCGEIRAYFHNRESPLRDTFKQFYIIDNGLTRRYELAVPPRVHAKGMLFKIKGITTPEAAKEWRGQAFYVLKECLPKQSKGGFYWFEAIGVRVIDETGVPWGKLDHLEGSETYTYLVILDSLGREILYPAHPSKLLSVERHPDGRIAQLVIESIPGLRGEDV